MKIKITFFFVFLWLFISFSSAQNDRQKFLGFEAGMNLIACKMTNMDYIRGNVPSYTGYSTNRISSMMYNEFIGIKPEVFLLNNRFGLSGGLRFMHINSSIGNNTYSSNSTYYFYMLYRCDGINTEYLKVNGISQKSDYIGIPIEIRYFANGPCLFRLYFKLGAEIEYLLQSKTDVVFYDNAMEPYQKDVIAIVGKPNSFSSSLNGSMGFRIGRLSKPSVSLEICFASLFLTSKSSNLVNPIYGGGFQLNVQIPIKSKAK